MLTGQPIAVEQPQIILPSQASNNRSRSLQPSRLTEKTTRNDNSDDTAINPAAPAHPESQSRVANKVNSNIVFDHGHKQL